MADSQTERNKRSQDKKIKAGLSRLVMMVHPDDKAGIRSRAMKLPKTKAIYEKLKSLIGVK